MIEKVNSIARIVDRKAYGTRLPNGIMVKTEHTNEVELELQSHGFDCYIGGNSTVMIVGSMTYNNKGELLIHSYSNSIDIKI